MSALAKAGYLVLMPVGVARYDMAIDARDGTSIKTVQVKTARLDRGCVIGVWCPGLDDAYLVPVDVVASRQGRLRLIPARNNQQSGIRWAGDYVIKGLWRSW